MSDIFGSEILNSADFEDVEPVISTGILISTFVEITSEFTYTVGQGFTDNLEIQNIFAYTVSHLRGLIDQMTLESQFNVYVDRLDFVGTPLTMVIDDFTTETRTLEAVGHAPDVDIIGDEELLITFALGSLVLALPAPEFENVHSVDLYTVRRETRGGDYISYRDPIWELTEQFKLGFKSLTKSERLMLKNFLRLTLGQPVNYIDIYGNTWGVIVLNPETEFSEEVTGFGVNLELQRWTG